MSAVLIPTAGPAAGRSRHLGLRKGRTQSHRYQHVEDLVRQGRDKWLRGTGEELSKGESLGGVAAEGVGSLAGVEVREDGLVEAQVGPACDEAEDGK